MNIEGIVFHLDEVLLDKSGNWLPGSRETIASLSERYPLGVIASTESAVPEEAVFILAVGDCYENVSRGLKEDPETILAVVGTDRSAAMARQAGMPIVCFLHDEEQLESTSEAVAVLRDIRALSDLMLWPRAA